MADPQEYQSATDGELSTPQQWAELVSRLPLQGMGRQLAEHCCVQSSADGHYRLLLDAGFENLRNPKWERLLEQALRQVTGEVVTLDIISAGELPMDEKSTPRQLREEAQRVRLMAAEASIKADPIVERLIDQFGGEIRPGSIKPL